LKYSHYGFMLKISRFFNTEGPINEEIHYCVPPLSRLDMEVLQDLIEQQKYFVLHAPRQTGKTTCLKAWVKHLNKQGQFRACYMNVEIGQGFRNDVEKAFLPIDGELVSRAQDVGEPRLRPLLKELVSANGAVRAFSELLLTWAQLDPRPLVLVIDEADSLVGDTLITLLRLLRSAH
jgi:Cdc6-like AAA superfamily ATPase